MQKTLFLCTLISALRAPQQTSHAWKDEILIDSPLTPVKSTPGTKDGPSLCKCKRTPCFVLQLVHGQCRTPWNHDIPKTMQPRFILLHSERTQPLVKGELAVRVPWHFRITHHMLCRHNVHSLALTHKTTGRITTFFTLQKQTNKRLLPEFRTSKWKPLRVANTNTRSRSTFGKASGTSQRANTTSKQRNEMRT